MNKKIIRLTESELKNIVEASVKRTINEGLITEDMITEGSLAKKLALYLGLPVMTVAAALADIGFGGPLSTGAERRYQEIQKNSQAFPEDREFLHNNDSTATFRAEEPPVKKANGLPESRIKKAVTESIRKMMTENMVSRRKK